MTQHDNGFINYLVLCLKSKQRARIPRLIQLCPITFESGRFSLEYFDSEKRLGCFGEK